MKASELIEKLKELMEEHGDLKVELRIRWDSWCYAEGDADEVWHIETDDEQTYEPCFLIFDGR